MNTLKSTFAKASFGVIAGVMALASVAGAATYQFSTPNLMVGSRGEAVKQLQMVLNSDADTKLAVAPGAGGSAGYETSYFGPATKAAVIKYQAKHNISPRSGLVGPLTRASLNAMTTTPTTPTTALCPNGMTLVSNCTLSPTTTPTTTTGPLSVMLAGTSPNNTTVLGGQALADLAHFTFSGNGTLTQATFQRTGLSTSADIASVYLFDGNMRVSDGASVNTNGQIIFSGLSIAVNGTKTLAVKADLNSSSFSSVSIGVTLTGYMVSGGTTATTVNVPGNILGASAAPSNSATASLGTNTVAAASINAGSMGYTVWSAPLTVSGRAVWLKGANFRVIGSAPSDAVQNIKLYVDGSPVGSPTSVNSMGYAFFDLGSGTSLNTGSHTIDVRGDIQKGSNRSFTFSIQNAADLIIADSQLGINITTSSAVTNGAAGLITVNSGSVTTTIDPSFQAMTNVTGGATNVPIAKFRLHAYGEDVKVSTLVVTPTLASQSSVAAAGLNNVTLYFNGSQVGSQTNMTSATTQALSFTLGSSLIIPAGVDSILEVRADLTTYSTNLNYVDGTISVALNAASSNINNGQGMSSLDSTIDVPAASIATSALTIQTGTLAISKNVALANQTINPNSTNQTIGSFVLQNQSTSESVRVTNLAVAMALTTAGSTNYSNLKTSETSGSGSTPINPATAAAGATSTNNFSVNFTLAPGATKVINVMTDVSSATGSLVVSLTPTALGSTSNVNVTPSAATGQTITISTGSFSSQSIVTSASTTARFIAAASATNGDTSTARFNLVASSGTAVVSEASFAVRGSSTVSARGTVASIKVGSQSAAIALATTDQTTLSTQLTSAQTTATLASGTGVAMGSVLLINSEQILVGSANAGTTTWNITRAYNGTTAATHSGAATVYVKNDVAHLYGLNLTVPNSTAGVNMDAVVTYAPVGTNGTTSGTVSTVSLNYLKYQIGNTTQTSCPTGQSCTNTLTESSSTAPTMTLVGSKPIVAAAAPATTTTFTATSTPAIDVTFTADAQGDITLVSFPITVSLTGATVDTAATHNIAVYIGSDFSTNYATSNSAFAASSGGSSTITLTNGGYRLSAGVPTVFHVYVTPTAVTAGVQVANMATSLTTGSGFSWTDTAGGGSATTGTTNIYGYPSNFSAVVHN